MLHHPLPLETDVSFRFKCRFKLPKTPSSRNLSAVRDATLCSARPSVSARAYVFLDAGLLANAVGTFTERLPEVRRALVVTAAMQSILGQLSCG